MRAVLVAAGLAAVAAMVAVTGVEALVAPIRTLSWRLGVLVVVSGAVVELLHTLAWRLAFVSPVPPGRLFAARLAGEALNLGVASVGGEPLKVHLLRPWVPAAEAAAIQVVDKTAVTAAQILFFAAGLAIVAPTVDLPRQFLGAMAGLVGLQAIIVGAFVLAQCAGLGDRALSLLRRLGMRPDGAHARGVVSFDRVLAASYRERRGRVLACTLVHLLGWIAGSLEVYLVLGWLHVDAPLSVALAIDACAAGIRFLAFVIPGAVGVLEGGYMAAFSAFGVGAALGLSFTLVRRLRLVAWALAGLVVLACLSAHAGVATPSAAPQAPPRP